MAGKRNYNVKGTKDFLVLSIIFFLLCVWAIRDAWFPSPKTLKKHPRQVEARFDAKGLVDRIAVEPGESVSSNTTLIVLDKTHALSKIATAKEAFMQCKREFSERESALLEATKSGAGGEKADELRRELEMAKVELNHALETFDEARAAAEQCELRTPRDGCVSRIEVALHEAVHPGDLGVVIDPEDHFYPFNKSLTVISLILGVAFLVIHVLGH